MKKIAFLVSSAVLVLGACAAQASTILNGAHLTSIDPATGNFAGGIESTNGCCAGATLYLGSYSPGNSLATTPGAAPDGYFDLGYTLPEGTTHFVLVGDYQFADNYGTDLFFNEAFGTGTVGASAPQITAYLDNLGNLSSGTAGAMQPIWGYSGTVPNGALSFTSGSDTVTLSNYAMGVNGDNLPFSSFDLTVAGSATPEPGTISLVFGAAAGIFVLRRRSSKV